MKTKFKFDISWLANSLALFASLLMSEKEMFIGFVILFLANIVFMFYGYNRKEWSFFWFNILFGINSLNGIHNWYDKR